MSSDDLPLLRFRITRCGALSPHARLCCVMKSPLLEFSLVPLVEEQSRTGILQRVVSIVPVLNDQA